DIDEVAEWRIDDEGSGSEKVEEMAVVVHEGAWQRSKVEWPEMAGILPVVVAGKWERKMGIRRLYKLTTVLVQAVAATDDSSVIPEHTTVETPMNMSPKNKARFQVEKEAIHLILTGIRDEIYSTANACQTAQEM
nr:hypothetical protein [Tanacetum cinerariifolium]